MAFRLHHCHKSCRWLVAYSMVHWSSRSRSHRWHSQTKSKARDEPNIQNVPTKCSLTAPRRAGTSFGFFFLFVSFHSASCLSLGDSVQRCLGEPVDVLAPWPSGFSRCDTSLTVDCCSFSICRTQSAEELGRVGECSLRSGWTARLSYARAATLTIFFFICLRGGEDSERGETKFSAGVTVTAPTTMHAEERQHECSQRRSEVRAGRLSSRFRLRAYRTVQTRPVSSRSVHHGIFPDVYFYTHPSAAARTAPNGVKERASFCLVFS